MDKQETYRLAIENELRSQKLYQALGASFTRAEFRTVFTELVMLEKNHEEKVRAACAREFPGVAMQIDPGLKADLKDMDLKDPVQVLEFAISREEMAQKLYRELAAQSSEPELKELLLRFANEENEHKNLLLTEIQRMQGALQWYDPSELNGLMED